MRDIYAEILDLRNAGRTAVLVTVVAMKGHVPAELLAWRVPVNGRRVLATLACLWFFGIALSVCLVLLSADEAQSLLWRRSVQVLALAPTVTLSARASTWTQSLLWRRSVQVLALALSVTVGALFLRALLRVRTSPISGRLLSLVSPIAILALIVILALTRA